MVRKGEVAIVEAQSWCQWNRCVPEKVRDVKL